jgi:phage terminase large subunit-like protein
VRQAVELAFENYRVVRMFCDPPYWQTDIDEWRARWGESVVRWPSYSDTKISEATARFDALVRAGEMRHNGDDELRRHLSAARRQRCRNGWRPAKKDGRKIDVLLATLAAIHANGDAVAAGLLTDSGRMPAVVDVWG